MRFSMLRWILPCAVIALAMVVPRARGESAMDQIKDQLQQKAMEALQKKTGGSAATRPEGRSGVNLNTAGVSDIEKLPGIDRATADRIVAGRPYAAVQDLSRAGVPQSTIAQIEPLVTVSEQGSVTAAGSGEGAEVVKTLVWADPDRKVFYFEGEPGYGTTAGGRCMVEKQAKKKGFHPAHEKTDKAPG